MNRIFIIQALSFLIFILSNFQVLAGSRIFDIFEISDGSMRALHYQKDVSELSNYNQFESFLYIAFFSVSPTSGEFAIKFGEFDHPTGNGILAVGDKNFSISAQDGAAWVRYQKNEIDILSEMLAVEMASISGFNGWNRTEVYSSSGFREAVAVAARDCRLQT